MGYSIPKFSFHVNAILTPFCPELMQFLSGMYMNYPNLVAEQFLLAKARLL